MKVIDKRATLLTVTFDDLLIGDCYQDDEGNICIKTSRDRCMYFDANEAEWRAACDDLDALIIPLQATIIVERSE